MALLLFEAAVYTQCPVVRANYHTLFWSSGLPVPYEESLSVLDISVGMSTPTVSGVLEECTLPPPHIPHLGLPCNITCSLGTPYVYFIFEHPLSIPLWSTQHKWAVFLLIALMLSLSLESLVLNWAHIMSFNKPIINTNIEMSKTVKIHVTNG